MRKAGEKYNLREKNVTAPVRPVGDYIDRRGHTYLLILGPAGSGDCTATLSTNLLMITP